MILPSGARRLAIFAYYDPDGRVDAYIPYLLNAVRPYCTRQVAVVNGTLCPAGLAALEACADEVVLRPNQGYDVTAYKEAFLAVEDLSAYDEILFYNQTIFGPVCPLDGMFTAMAARDVDFWGLTRHKGARAASWDDSVPILPHVQSFFFAVRASLFRAPEFTAYWQGLPPIETYWDAVGKHEVVFTDHFARKGYTWDVYVPTGDLEVYNDYPLMGMPVTLLEQRGCPFFKRKTFITERHQYTTVPQGAAARELYRYLREKTSYPTALVTENLLRTAPLADSVKALGLVYDVAHTPPRPADVAVVLNVTTPTLAPMLAQAARALPADTPVWVLCADDDLRRAMARALPGAVCTLCETRGPQALFGPLWPQAAAHEYLLYLSDDMPLLLEQFADATSLDAAVDALRPGPCAALMEADENLGLLIPLMPSHQEALTLGLNLPQAAEALDAVLQKAGAPVPLGKAAGIASRGGMFFGRTKALTPLARASLPDGLFEGLFPAWELLPMLAAQGAGFLTAFAAAPDKVSNELMNKSAMLDQVEALWATPRKMTYGHLYYRMEAMMDFYYERRYQMTLEQAFAAPLTAKQKLWICLQILLKPTTFQKLHRLLGRKGEAPPLPADPLD